MTTESDALLFARFPHEKWNTPSYMTHHKTGEVRYYCKLCTGLGAPPAWESLSSDETITLAHIKEQHGLDPVASVYIRPEDLQSKASTPAYWAARLLHRILP